ncbi:Nif3-like dinuclear metal center hexameric protein [Methyloversatilis sp.]|uniref:Nif3-like dinuclear metal center hexameric protein n=1 Tax=Methyloversatilis sp. TaxID=2569862 RepID=UPI00273308FA|nr:Nif3-like dinuclear metal center hexameric protein [Methyloversatilis sp.]MDP2867967.1 Nif3-like dinuclear metal center hexameric protein [Methyloversatilis sp.]MDP3456797.1 Nif3-like dinuclear metal center hexameric protein [Methyloversatilis sp.]MDP3576419.1 Nif3-like dinuclear metal center hexameric protein [Methyloversatilis sp.]
MDTTQLQRYLDELLDAARFKDYCPNGLQVEGASEVSKIVCGVSASLALIEAAIERGAQALLVHHGWFWRGEDGRVTGTRRARMARVLAHDINLFAYHLPLDAHPELGNNARLGSLLDFRPTGTTGEQGLIWLGEPEQPATAAELCMRTESVLGRKPLLVGDAQRIVRRVAWCTGAAQGFFEQAIDAGVDLFISGEISEPTAHLARESGVPYIAAGHHATERYGVKALGAHLAERFGLTIEFVDIDNPA